MLLYTIVSQLKSVYENNTLGLDNNHYIIISENLHALMSATYSMLQEQRKCPRMSWTGSFAMHEWKPSLEDNDSYHREG